MAESSQHRLGSLDACLCNKQVSVEEVSTNRTGNDVCMSAPFTATRRGRECIVPEVSRTKHIGDQGANVNAKSASLYHRMAWATAPLKTDGKPAFGELWYLVQSVSDTGRCECSPNTALTPCISTDVFPNRSMNH